MKILWKINIQLDEDNGAQFPTDLRHEVWIYQRLWIKQTFYWVEKLIE